MRASPASWILVAVIAGALAGSVHAHARLQRSTPAHNAILDRAPPAIVLHFASAVERGFARFQLRGPNAEERTLVARAGTGLTRELVLPLDAAGPGAYQLRWSVVSRDGHRIAGTLRFTIQRR